MSTEPQIRFIYLRNKTKTINGNERGFPVACLALKIDRNINTVTYGLSTVHPDDAGNNYSKDNGRALSAGRLVLGGNAIKLPPNKHHSVHDILWMLFLHLHRDKSIPTRAKKAIQRWLNDAAEADFHSVKNDIMSDIVLD